MKYSSASGSALSPGPTSPSPPPSAGMRTHASGGKAGRASSKESLRSLGSHLSMQGEGSVRYGDSSRVAYEFKATTSAAPVSVQARAASPAPVPGMRMSMSVGSLSGSPAPRPPTHPARGSPAPAAACADMKGADTLGGTRAVGRATPTPTSASVETEDGLRRKNRRLVAAWGRVGTRGSIGTSPRTRMQGLPGQSQSQGSQVGGSSFFLAGGSAILVGDSIVFGELS